MSQQLQDNCKQLSYSGTGVYLLLYA